jgi:hypothetical protein
MNIPMDTDIISENEKEENLFNLIFDILTSLGHNGVSKAVKQVTVPQFNYEARSCPFGFLDCSTIKTISHLGKHLNISTRSTKDYSQIDRTLHRDTLER